ncbi:MAG: 5'-deoxyadenosine deaminase [Myxococcales bacterium]|nr:5'-deoxyadenosine deaminase [Myxococcales bacterium]
MSEVILRGGTIITVDDESSITTGDVASVDGVLVRVGGNYTPTKGDYSIVDAEGCIVMPGLVQSHVHMCQTLARGRADNMELLDWLHKVVWPYEGALTRADLEVSANLSCLELLSSGTTAILDMGTVHHTDTLFEAAQASGLRATIGKAMMDEEDPAIPPGLQESTKESLEESQRLCKQWHGRCADRLRYGYAPRFVLSCTDELMQESVRLAREVGARLHTHTSENRSEIAEVKRRKGVDNLSFLHKLGFSGEDVCLAHCVWLSEAERTLLSETGTHVLHCPSSNMKLASGYAEIPELLDAGIKVSLGADGAPCNNTLDAFVEMRLAALLHKPRVGPKAMPASMVLRLATRGGAAALGLEDRIGSLEVGKRADVIALDVTSAHCVPMSDPYSTVVYSAQSSDVKHVIVDGKVLIRDKEVLTIDKARTLRDAQVHADRVFARL